MRTGSEPSEARSALRMRFGLAAWGLVWALAGTVIFAEIGHLGWAIACGVVAAIAAVDLIVVVHRMHQGPHWQPGRDVPPYRPLGRR
ncbi:DUF6343 family protein [Streptomyces sp. NPDC004647]|uniref:DUF6343 family protein n=1 Tax=Streptomyces sp. NPDC004647 TaxID=3154671 RepID=UPI0033A07EC4